MGGVVNPFCWDHNPNNPDRKEGDSHFHIPLFSHTIVGDPALLCPGWTKSGLSDEDVERVAKRVTEMLAERKEGSASDSQEAGVGTSELRVIDIEDHESNPLAQTISWTTKLKPNFRQYIFLNGVRVTGPTKLVAGRITVAYDEGLDNHLNKEVEVNLDQGLLTYTPNHRKDV